MEIKSLIDRDFEKLIAHFQAIASIQSPLKRRFALVKIASLHSLPKAEIRKLFDLFIGENLGGGDK